jgi:hypothetical protein
MIQPLYMVSADVNWYVGTIAVTRLAKLACRVG